MREKITLIEKEMENMENSQCNNINNRKLKALYTNLNELYDKKIKGAQIRSKAKWIESGEKNTKYFLNLEKQNQTSNVIKELNTDSM